MNLIVVKIDHEVFCNTHYFSKDLMINLTTQTLTLGVVHKVDAIKSQFDLKSNPVPDPDPNPKP